MNLLPEPRIDLLVHTHHAVTVTANEDPGLEHRLFVPKGWLAAVQTQHGAPKLGRPMPISFFREPIAGDDAATIIVSMLHVPFEVGLRDWLTFDLARQGYAVFHVADPAGTAVKHELGAWSGDGTNRRIRRVHALVDNGRVFLVTAEAPVARWLDVAPDLAVSGYAFELVYPTGTVAHERLTAHTDRGLRVQLPLSWGAEPGRSRTQAIHAWWRTGNIVHGLLRVLAEKHPYGLARRYGLLRRDLAQIAVTVPEVYERFDDPCLRAIDGWEEARRAKGRIGPIEVEVTAGFRRIGDQIVHIVALGPMAAVDPIGWMRVKRAFEIAAESTEVEA